MRDLKKQRDWIKKNTRSIVGVRVFKPTLILDGELEFRVAIPEQFFYHKKSAEPYVLWPTKENFHIPRSLVRRARVTININTNKIVAKTTKCFKGK